MRCYSLLILPALFSMATGAPADDATKKELQLLQGTWRAVSVVGVDAEPMPDEDLRVTKLVIEGNHFSLTTKMLVIFGTFTIDPTKTPKTIDVTLATAENPEQRMLGVYQIDGNSRKSCFALVGEPRPKDLAPSSKGFLRFEWKR